MGPITPSCQSDRQFTEKVSGMVKKYTLVILVALLCSGLSVRMHAAAAGGAASTSEFPYVALAPSFVTNYDGGGRLRYVKIDVTVRTQRPGDAVVQLHMPYLRNRLVKLFSSQLEENLTSTEGKEQLRATALAEIRGAIDYLDGSGSENILDIYFTSFVIQQ